MRTIVWVLGALWRFVAQLGEYLNDVRAADARAKLKRDMDADPLLRQWVEDAWRDHQRSFCGACAAGAGRSVPRCVACMVALDAVMRERLARRQIVPAGIIGDDEPTPNERPAKKAGGQ